MQNTNSYFVLEMEENRVYMNYYPPTGTGEELTMSEISGFFEKQKITGYTLKEINDKIKDAKEPVRFLISEESAMDYNESMELKVTPDGIYAIARFFPPSKNGSRMSEREIRRDLEYHKIVYGINENEITKHMEEPQYFKNILIAVGKKPRQGRDGRIDYCFHTDRTVKPRLNEDGTVNFHQLDNIAHVHKGDVLAKLTPVDKGEPGKSVYGKDIRQNAVKKIYFKYGRDVVVSEDGLELISQVDGYAVLENDKVFVSNEYDIPNDVDNSTGDVEFAGSIVVHGNVRTGFNLKAKGNIEVYGVVEGAVLEADGDVVIHRGVQGMNRCKLIVGGNLVAKFIESASITVAGSITADSIFNSKVSAQQEITVTGKGGSIIGGVIRSTKSVEATSIGTEMGAATSIEVGIDPGVKDRIKELETLIQKKTEEVNKLEQLVTLFRKKEELGVLEEEKIPMIPQFTKSIILGKTEIQEWKNEHEEKLLSISEDENACIKVTKEIYAGTVLTVSGASEILHDTYTHVIYTKKDGEIVSRVW